LGPTEKLLSASKTEASINDNNVRLAICSMGELFGGVERHVLDLCTYAQRRHGTYPLLVLFHDGELARQARSLGITPVVLAARGRYDPALGRELAQAIASFRVNLVHVHGYKAVATSLLARRRAASRFAVVKTEHGRPEQTGDRLGACKLRLNEAIGNWATRRVASAVSYVTAELSSHYARAHNRLRRCIIPNGIDPLDRSAFSRPPELEPGWVHLGIVGRVTEVKGISFALRAFASEGVPATIRLNVLGAGPQQVTLERQARELGLGPRVRFLGFRRDVRDFLAHLDGLLMPSLYEGLPYTLLEAMSLGKPIIASRVGGLAEVLRDGETGLLVPVADVTALRAAIVRLVADVPFAELLGQAAAAAQRRHYTLDRMGAMYWGLYADCVAKDVL
jgi:glycosyltransferase involved in cell wall biosynthesis